MKTKTFLLMFLFLGIAFTRLSAQDSQKNVLNKSVIDTGISEPYRLSVFCNGVQVDDLICTTPFHYVNHYQKGTLVWLISKNFGNATSLRTGEVFKLKDTDRINITDDRNLQGIAIEHVNLIGNEGSHYIATLIYAWPTWEIKSVVKATCPGTDK